MAKATTRFENLLTNKWDNPENFNIAWEERSEVILQLLINAGISSIVSNFTEYGCGPNRPFYKIAKKWNNDLIVIPADRKKWSDDCILVDLNESGLAGIPSTDCGILSGVIEYLNDPEEVFSAFAEHHKFILFSYAIINQSYENGSEANNLLSALNRRASLGWRNHFSISEIIKVSSNFGYLLSVGAWKDQILFAVANKNVK